ncbi:ABC transporter permease [Demequina activiva]|uniref:ABC transporter substrate-binding protein n=1 Tax=Demequina activiva TaxID=1582364 RepID=A0A919Q441_9MICO|nr:FtsX-like permease family protein [Demequina activiva]GIG54857.1 ABC transporter substrate-binding protein [Demequina activiva]
MFRLALKSVRHNPKRLILTAIAVALGVSLVAASHTFTNALSSGFSGLFSEIYAGTDVIVETDPESAESDGGDPFAAVEAVFEPAVVDDVAAVDGVDVAVGGIQVAGSVLPPDTGEDAPTDPFAGGPPSQIFNWSGIPEIDQSTLVDGRGPEAGEIVLDIDSAPGLGYELGDTVRIATDGGVQDFELVGTVQFGESNSLQGATLAYLADEDAHALAGDPNFQQISVLVEDGADASAVAGSIGEVIPDGTRAITGEDKAAEETEALDDVLQYVDIFAIAFALISLFVGAYIIVNTFRIIVTQRTREFGLMRAIGVTGSQVRSMILLEAIVVAILASTLGIIAGYLLALGASALVSLFVGDIFGTMTLPIDAILWAYGLGTLVTLVSALLPAIHASQISPMEALRESATSGKKPLKVRNIVGTALALVGGIVIWMGLFLDLERPYIYVGAGAVALVIGVTLLAAQVLVPMAFGLRSLLTRMFGVDGKLAANNIRREPRRSANTAAALMIGVMLLALVATFTESLKTVVTAQFSQTSAEFFVFSAQGPVPQGALDVIAEQDGVSAVVRQGYMSVDLDGQSYQLSALDADTVDRAFDYDTEPEFSGIDGGVFISPDVRDAGVAVGDEVTLEGPEGDVTLVVTGTMATSEEASLWVDWAQGVELAGDTLETSGGMVVLEDGMDVDEAQTQIQDALADDFPLVALQQPGALEQFANQFIDLLLGVISALLASALVIAILGVANTLLLSVTERTREIGLLRAVGLKRSSVWRMITVESMVMAVFGTILGMILGVSLGSALVLALEDFGFDGVTVPWIWLIVYTVLAAIAGVLAAIWPAWRASRLDILKAIATDG